MAEEEKNEEEKQVVVAPQSAQEFFWAHFNWLVVLLVGLLAAAFVPVNGVPLISSNQMVVGLTALIIVFVVLPMMVFFKRKNDTAGVYIPYDPEKENHVLEKKVENIVGGTVRIKRILGEPEFGEKSSEPYVMHFKADYVSRSGIVGEIAFKASLISRAILSIEPGHSHIEDSVFSWAAFPKYPKINQPPKLIYKVREASIRPELPKKEEETEEEEE